MKNEKYRKLWHLCSLMILIITISSFTLADGSYSQQVSQGEYKKKVWSGDWDGCTTATVSCNSDQYLVGEEKKGSTAEYSDYNCRPQWYYDFRGIENGDGSCTSNSVSDWWLGLSKERSSSEATLGGSVSKQQCGANSGGGDEVRAAVTAYCIDKSTVETEVGSTSNTNAPPGSLWIENSAIHWATGTTEYWLKNVDNVLSENFDDENTGDTPAQISGVSSGSDCGTCQVDSKGASGNGFYQNIGSGDDWQDALVKDFSSNPLTDTVTVTGRYWESSSNHDGNFWVQACDGTYLAGIGTENPQFEAVTANGGEVVNNGGHDYQQWTFVEMVLDLNAGNVDFYWDQQGDTLNRDGYSIPTGKSICKFGVGPDDVWYVDDIDITATGRQQSGPSGSLWIEGSAIRWIDGNNDEKFYVGSDTGNNPSSASPGNLWMESNALHYIDASGNELKLGEGLKSCSQASGSSGVYTIDPDGSGGVNPFDVYCEMSEDGGGWIKLRMDNRKNQYWWTKKDSDITDGESRDPGGSTYSGWDWTPFSHIGSNSDIGTYDFASYTGDTELDITWHQWNDPSNTYSRSQMDAIRSRVSTISSNTEAFSTSSDDDGCRNGEAILKLTEGGTGYQITHYTSSSGQYIRNFETESEMNNYNDVSYLIPAVLEYENGGGCSGAADFVAFGYEKDYVLVK